MKLLALTAAAILVVACGAARAEDDETQEEEQVEAPRSAPRVHRQTPEPRPRAKTAPAATHAPAAQAPAVADGPDAGDEADDDGKRHAMTEAEKIEWYCKKHADEGAGCRNHALLLLPYISDYAQYDDSDVRGNTIRKNPCAFSPLPPGCPGANASSGGGTLSGAPLVGSSNASGGVKLVFPTFKSAAALRDGNYGRFILNWNSYGPGTVFSFGFRPRARGGGWGWVENVNSTDQCKYEGWISKTPGGPALGPTPGPCGVDASNAMGSMRGWEAYRDEELARLPKPPLCPLKWEGQYFFNLKLTWWGPNPNAHNVISCIEYLAPNGDGSYYDD